MAKFFLLAIVILAASLRLFFLPKVPPGFIPEEASSSWNAYSILKTGRDEWGNFLPLVFKEAGAYKLPLGSYAIVPSIALLGLNEASVRLPTALASIAAIILTYFVSLQLFRNKTVALLASFFLAISPWHIAVGRYAVEVNWGIPVFLCGLYFFLTGVKQPRKLILAGLFFGISYYTYFSFMPFTLMFVVGLLFFHRFLFSDRKRRGKKYLYAFIFIQILFLIPFLANTSLKTRYQQTTFIDDIGIVDRLNEHRGACRQRYPLPLCRMIYNKPLAFALEKIRNYINHFSTTVFFLYGGELNLSGMPARQGLFFLVELPLILIGAFLLAKKGGASKILLLWLLLYPLPSASSGEGHIWRMMTLLPLPQIAEAYAAVVIFSSIKRLSISLFITFVFCLFFLMFLTDYFGYFALNQGHYSYYGFRDLYKYLKTVEKDYDHIVVAPINLGFNQLYIYYLFYNQYNPWDFLTAKDIERRLGEKGFAWVDRIGKYHFVGEVKKVKYPLDEKTLLVLDNSKDDLVIYDQTLKAVPIHKIFYPNGKPAFLVTRLVKK